MHNFVKQNIIVHFIIKRLKNKHTFLKNVQTEKAEEPLILTEQEETKNQMFRAYELTVLNIYIYILCLKEQSHCCKLWQGKMVSISLMKKKMMKTTRAPVLYTVCL